MRGPSSFFFLILSIILFTMKWCPSLNRASEVPLHVRAGRGWRRVCSCSGSGPVQSRASCEGACRGGDHVCAVVSQATWTAWAFAVGRCGAQLGALQCLLSDLPTLLLFFSFSFSSNDLYFTVLVKTHGRGGVMNFGGGYLRRRLVMETCCHCLAVATIVRFDALAWQLQTLCLYL